jgi:hypothetical protein
MRRILILGAVSALALSACSSDPTTTEEYRQVEADKAAAESQLEEVQTELEAAEVALEQSEATVSELQPQLSNLESEKARSEERAEELEGELEGWIEFTGSPNDEPFFWSQELFDATVLTCTADGTSEEDCMCIMEGLESELYLMEMMLMTELVSAATVGLVPVNPLTEMPEGIDSEVVGILTEAFVECLG